MKKHTMSGSKTDALPKRGHVNEVCKEWGVREDGALAYKLQSQEINDFYKGNRYRNEVVRTDFPTALEEQIKEKENAEKQTECYKKYLSEQEEHDKRVAMQIAEKLERDLLEQRQRELEESEAMADKLQNIYVNVPPIGALNIIQPDTYSENASVSQNSREFSQAHHSQDVGLPLTVNLLNSHVEDFLHSKDHHHQKNYKQKSSHNSVHDTHDAPRTTNVSSSSRSTNMNRPKHSMQQSLPLDSIVQYTDAIEPSAFVSCDTTTTTTKQTSHSHPSKNKRSTSDIAGDSPIRADFNLQRTSHGNFDPLEGNPRHRHQHHDLEHVDDIELYVDPSLQEIGLPIEEIQEINKKMKQERKDEELARRLQEMEKLNGLTLEDRDRLLAIEAQDKELAKMLQEREKAKAKRAKEKARLRKHQYQKDSNGLHNGPLLPLPQDSLASTPASNTEEIDQIDLDAYSNPKDLISHQRIESECFRGSSSIHSTLVETADNSKEDDIYTLPIDSCGPNRTVVAPKTHSPEGLLNHSLTRSEQYSLSDIQHDSHDPLRMNHSMSSSYDKNSGPAPPYMPIQGTRRSNSNEERKKRSKDKCTHQ